MKKLIVALILGLTLFSSLLAGTSGGMPLAFADSYMMRARGSEAVYWNPALLGENVDIWLPLLNTSVFVTNNVLDLELYNDIMRRGVITEADKTKILDRMRGSLKINTNATASLFGFTLRDVAFSSSVQFYGKAALSKRYLELLLYGNEEEHYEFSKKNNHLASFAFADFTVGKGNIILPLPESIPVIRAGFSGSLLFGIEEIHTSQYHGIFSSSLDGLHLDQDITLRTGAGGLGFKGMVGLASEPIKNLQVGITLDNILGNIRWGLVSQNLHYSLTADSVYVADLDEDVFVQENWTEDAGAFGTTLPMELRMGALYNAKQVSLSADWVQGFASGINTSSTGRLSFGAELRPLPFFPIRLGFSPGNSSIPWRMAYGLGLNIKPVEFGVGFQAFDSLFPSPQSKGIAMSIFMRSSF